MRNTILLLGVIFFMTATLIVAEEVGGPKMKITSPEFEDNKYMPKRFGYEHDNTNPTLIVEGIPSGAKSLVLIVDDPDAARGWVHWLVYDMPLISRIEEGGIPGRQGMNDFRTLKYGGPCPPSGTHRYFFRIYALDKELGLKEGADRKAVEKAMEGYVLGKAELVGLYKR